MTKKFYELSDNQRIDELVKLDYLDSTDKELLQHQDVDKIKALSENTIGITSLPMSVVYPIIVNGKKYVVPMATEEPSVVAAASNGAQRANKNGGFVASITEKLVVGQIVWEVNDVEKLERELLMYTDELADFVQEARPSLINRGGGLDAFQINTYDRFVELLIYIDTVDAMGANIVNSICEYVANKLDQKINMTHLIAVLSNDGSEQIVNVTTKIKLEDLATKNIQGETVAKKIAALSDFTQQSLFRDSTNNKGILNGVFAALIATGNDTRAVSAAVTSFNNASLSKWHIENNQLVGELEIPMPIGTVGGAISSLDSSQVALKLLNVESAKELAQVVASIGLANNLSAMRALVTSGIQSGHMNLQSKSLAISAGAQNDEIELIAKKLNKLKKYDLATAKNMLNEIRGKN
ncbi:3-hydroxy-3-methylglutaryl coenzyme A reductase [Companilactobacillus sp. RD055328]|uniref:hydroxymethylglutaryl-CoA reductase, degradative n=1 Tax=Companilactobacillus sp. RD055328 TaxID=2916634 RepID=UPI001FC84FCD|nr:hydroxymethylglutaryl-CoA reductase, degradative [Companilactobacillus sp. RD055328]GKQ43112.1 3-hydroxy-3-methylglutaryl coenzyme A reductase [Companilactobacillus sp. RD055328]